MIGVVIRPRLAAETADFSLFPDQLQPPVLLLTVIRRTHRVVESLHPTEFPFKSLRVFDRKRFYLVNRL